MAPWFQFLVDSVNERHLVRLGATDPTDYERGACSMHFQVSRSLDEETAYVAGYSCKLGIRIDAISGEPTSRPGKRHSTHRCKCGETVPYHVPGALFELRLLVHD